MQDEASVTYAEKLTKEEGLLDWSESATVLERKIRAFTPVLGAEVGIRGFDEPVKIWAAEVLSDANHPNAQPGTVRNQGLNWY